MHHRLAISHSKVSPHHSELQAPTPNYPGWASSVRCKAHVHLVLLLRLSAPTSEPQSANSWPARSYRAAAIGAAVIFHALGTKAPRFSAKATFSASVQGRSGVRPALFQASGDSTE